MSHFGKIVESNCRKLTYQQVILFPGNLIPWSFFVRDTLLVGLVVKKSGSDIKKEKEFERNKANHLQLTQVVKLRMFIPVRHCALRIARCQAPGIVYFDSIWHEYYGISFRITFPGNGKPQIQFDLLKSRVLCID